MYSRHIPCGDVADYACANSMLSVEGIELLYEFALITDVLDGCVAEAGVASGGVIYLLASVMVSKRIYGFDSWKGLPKAVEQDLVNNEPDVYEGWAKESQISEEMQEELAKFGDRVRLIEGWFCDTLPVASNETFCFLHLDADRYESTKQCLEFFWPRMVSGGVIIIDDYAFHRTPGVTLATDAFLDNKEYDVLYLHGGKPIIRIP